MAPAATIAVVSGLVLAVLGAALLFARPRKVAGSVFAAFLVLWGLEIGFLNLSRGAGSPDAALSLLSIGVALKVPHALLLLHFAASYAPALRRRFQAATWVAAVFAATAAVVFVLDPRSIVESVARSPDGYWAGRFGILNVLLIGIPSFAAFYGTAYILHRAYSEFRAPLDRQETGLVLAALMLYVAHVTPYYLLIYVLGWSSFVPLLGAGVAGLFVAVFLAGGSFVGIVAARLGSRLRRGTAPAQRSADRAILAAILVPATAGAIGAAPLAWGAPPVETLGLFRILAAALVAYGILKHHVFGLDLGVKRAVRVGFPVAVGVLALLAAGGALRSGAGDVDVAGLPAYVVGGTGVGLVAAAVAFPARRRVADLVLPYVEDEEDYRRARALEVYRAALVQAYAQGGLDTDPFLRDLRRSLGVSDREHDILRVVARTDAASSAGDVPRAAPGDAGLVRGRYARERVLGEGGFARVWLAADRTLDRPVVLKELFHPGPALLQEARAAGAVQSPHVVTVHDVLQDEDRSILVLEYVPGGSLQDLLEREGRLPRGRALEVAGDLLRGLAAIHARGIVHRDVKPGNVLLTGDGRAKVTDFGISEAEASPTSERPTTAAFAAAPGTLFYMAPEQVTGERVDARADVYAAGAVLYQLLTGRFYLDFGNKGDYAIRRMIVEAAPRLPLRGEPDDVSAILERALDKEPDRRFATAEGMLMAVDACRRASAATGAVVAVTPA